MHQSENVIIHESVIKKIDKSCELFLGINAKLVFMVSLNYKLFFVVSR